MTRLAATSFVLFAGLAASTTLAQVGGVPYNRGLVPASAHYDNGSSGSPARVVVELRMSNVTTSPIDLSSVLTMRVNGAVVGDPASLPIEVGPVNQSWGCRENWCETVCRNGWCRNFEGIFCICIHPNNDSGNNSANRIAMPTPPLHVGDVVELSLAAMPGGALTEFDTSDDLVEFVIQEAPCAADLNGDGLATSQDFFQFLTAFFSGSAQADINHDGAITSQDFFDFLAAFFSGC